MDLDLLRELKRLHRSDSVTRKWKNNGRINKRRKKSNKSPKKGT